MSRRMPPLAWTLASLALGLAHSVSAQNLLFTGEANSSGAAGSLPAGQADRGESVYARLCVTCHGPSLEGTQFGPPLKGEVFVSRWRGRPHASLSHLIRTTMPPGQQGSVSAQDYTDVETYLLLANGASAVSSPTDSPRYSIATRTESQNVAASGSESRPPSPFDRRSEDDPRLRAALEARSAKLATLSSVTDAMLANPSPADWLMWRRTYDGLGHSPLRQINRRNVKHLRAAWSWSLPESMNEITPLVHGGVMFVYSGAVVQALDAVTGDLLWQYQRPLPDGYDNGRRSRVKSLAIHGDKLFVPTADSHMVALDMRSGRVLWDKAIIPSGAGGAGERAAAIGLQANGGPIVANGHVIFGVSLGLDYGGGCFIVGLDLETGEERWRFHTIARPGQPGGDTWNGAPVEERFGGGVWTAGSYDPELDLVYFGIGNTYNTATLLEPRTGTSAVTANDALYTNATIALRPKTGELVWFYQHHKRDVWDLDWVFEQSVVTLRVDGEPRKVIVTGGKTALFDVVDAATGSYVFSKDFGLQNLVLAIDPVTGEKTVNPAVEPEAGKSKLLCPGNFGTRNWPATALNPETRVLFVPMVEQCSDYTYVPRRAEQTAAGGIDMRFVQRMRPGSDGLFGHLAALDLQTREILWTHRQRIPLAGSALTTAGGLLFNGDLDRHFFAFDQKTGKILWKTRLNAAPESTPISYAVNGRQYVAVVAGGSSAFSSGIRGLVPELATPAPGITLHVFALP